jgi:hypothetical protein
MSLLLGNVQSLCILIFTGISLNAQSNSVVHAATETGFGRVPLYFEENRGQLDSQARYIARGANHAAFVTRDGLMLSFQGQAIAMHIVDAAPQARMAAQGDLEGVSNYYLGQRAWTGLKHFSSVRVSNIRPGVDILYHANDQSLEYDLIIHPGGSPESVRLRFEGGPAPELNNNGDLVFKTASEELTQHVPRVWQQVGGQRRPIACRYVLSGPKEVRLHLSPYDRSRDLVVDPVLSYSTYLAGSSTDGPMGIAVDSSGSAYVAGYTDSTNFPVTTGTFQGYSDAFATKLNASGTGLIYSTFIGGSLQAQANAIAIGPDGDAFVTGYTSSSNFPFTNGIFAGGEVAFAAELGLTGDLVYATALGGDNFTTGTAIAVDTHNAAYVTGGTSSVNFPTTAGPENGKWIEHECVRGENRHHRRYFIRHLLGREFQ